MGSPDYEVIKEIPGYKVILKAVLKSQIQQLVQQLASSTDEESVILTASVADGTLSHLGSESGKGFLEDHEDIKSQFLGFCLKKYHRKKHEKKELEEAESFQQSMQASPVRYGPHGAYAVRSPRFTLPPGHRPLHPVALTRASPSAQIRTASVRHEPYPTIRPPKPIKTSLNLDPCQSLNSGPRQNPMTSLPGNKSVEQVIKIEEDDNDASSHSEDDIVNQNKPGSTSESPSRQANPPSSVISESGYRDDDAHSNSSTSTIPNEQSNALGLDSDLSNLISGTYQEHDSESGEIDTDISVKLEALTENEMELEITGVEPGRPIVSQDDWDPNIAMGMNLDPTGATGDQGDMAAQGYMSWQIMSGNPLTLRQCPLSDLSISPMLPHSSESCHTRMKDELGRNMFVCQYGNCARKFDRKGTRHLMEGEMVGTGQTTSSAHLSIAGITKISSVLDTDIPLLYTRSTTNSSNMFDGTVPMFICQFEKCKKIFKSRQKVERHMLTHTGEKPFGCRFCCYRSSRKDQIKVHEFSRHYDELKRISL